MNLSLTDKNALICGATQGIGLAIAQELALLGANCTLIARNKESLEKAIATLANNGKQTHNYLIADFSNNAEVLAVVQTFATENIIHILINNTGGPPSGPIINAQATDFLNAYQLHLINNHNISQTLLPKMITAGYGRIINIVSTSVKIPLANLGVSNTTRAAVAG